MSRSVYSTILGIFLAVSLILPITLLAANPTIISLTPDSGPVGTQVQISGSGFGLTQGTSTVTFNGTSATASSWSDTQITATVPTAATTGAVKVTVGGIGSNTNVFFTVPGPQVTGDGRLRYGAQWIALSPIEHRLARALAARFGDVVNSEVLASVAWPDDTSNEGALRVHLTRLRRRLRSLGLEIQNVRGRGYLMEPAAG